MFIGSPNGHRKAGITRVVIRSPELAAFSVANASQVAYWSRFRVTRSYVRFGHILAPVPDDTEESVKLHVRAAVWPAVRRVANNRGFSAEVVDSVAQLCSQPKAQVPWLRAGGTCRSENRRPASTRLPSYVHVGLRVTRGGGCMQFMRGGLDE